MVSAERRAHLALLKPPPAVKAVPVPVLDAYDSRRFWQKVRKAPNGACWLWTAATSAQGYGRFKIAGRLYGAHRLAYVEANGPIVNMAQYHGSVVMHSCDNPGCCNPAHLTLGPQRANVKDMWSKGRATQTQNLPTVPGRVPTLSFAGRV